MKKCTKPKAVFYGPIQSASLSIDGQLRSRSFVQGGNSVKKKPPKLDWKKIWEEYFQWEISWFWSGTTRHEIEYAQRDKIQRIVNRHLKWAWKKP